jgi:flagellin
MRINTNVAALQAQRAMSEHNKTVENASGKLAAGTRVRSAADDAASLAIGNKTKTEIRSKTAALRNANDAISEFQIAEGSMNEISNMLVRLKELSMQAANGHLENEQRQLLNLEYMEMRREIERTINDTSRNGFDVLTSTGGSQIREYQIGTGNDADSKFRVDQGNFALTEFNMSLVDSNVINAEEARLNLGYIDQAIQKVSSARANLGAVQGRVTSAINNLDISKSNESAAYSQTMDADFAFEASEKIRGEIKLDAASSILAQSSNFSAMALKLLKD